MHDELAQATLQIESGDSSGTGFHYREEELVVTNAHVVAPSLQGNVTPRAVTESGEKVPLDLLDFSLPGQYDYAILELQRQFSEDRHVLTPHVTTLDRGEKLLFSGFPHGISDLLVNEAIVSGPYEDVGFYLDGTVNGGNSGGPIVEKETGDVVGIITERRHLTPEDMDDIIRNMDSLADQLQNDVAVDMVMSGISLNEVLQIMGEGFVAMKQAIDANANTGIGIGYYVEELDDAVSRQIDG